MRRRGPLPLVLGTTLVCGGLLAAGAPPSLTYPIQPVAFSDVVVDDGFWAPKLEVNRTVSIPHIFRQNEQTGRVANFEKAAGRKPGTYEGRRFNDTDIYKAIEAACYTLKTHPDAELRRQVDALVALIAAAQQPDGYVFPARTIDPSNPAPGVGPARWVYLNGSHELYNFGHLYEAAIAHRIGTGADTLFTLALKNADLVAHDFGPSARKAVPGHEEIELALIRLFRESGDAKYFALAKWFLDERGKPHETEPYPDGPFAMYNDLPYKQDHAPVVEQTRAVGHAVRAAYLYMAMADVAALGGDPSYARAIDTLWSDVVSKRMYITGGIGSRGTVEAFGEDYELPNQSAYAETCASIGNTLWNHRMFLRTGDGRQLDVLERVLYNGFLSGVSQGGDRFFYQNPLESTGRADRSAYFDVACCPANLARLMAQLPGLIYATRLSEVFVNLFVGSRTTIKEQGTAVAIRQTTNYPWDGAVGLSVDPSTPVAFTLRLRIPGWARDEGIASDLYRFAGTAPEHPILRVNGKNVALGVSQGFARITRRWTAGDRVELNLPMPVRRVLAHDGVEADRGRAAIQRGPLVYAIEGVDNGGHALNLALPVDAALAASFRKDLLGGVVAITGPAQVAATASAPPSTRLLVAIPYYAWNNRGRGEMAVWIPVVQR